MNLKKKKVILPYNFSAEKLVLGNILILPELIITISEKLPIEAFYLESHQVIYRTLLLLYAEGKTIDYINVITWIQDNGLLSKVGGAHIIIDLVNQISHAGNLDQYIGLIYEKYLRRILIKLGEEIIESGYLNEVPLEMIFTKVEQKLFLLAKNNSLRHLVSVKEGLQEVLGDIEYRLRLPNPNLPYGLHTNFVEFDYITHGFHKSDLIILAGRPSMGKTAFAFNLVKNIAATHDIGIIFFSLEMTRQQLLYRLLASEVGISNTRLRASKIKEKEWQEINNIVNQLSKLKLYIDDTPNLSVSEIKLRIKTVGFESLRQINIGLIAIDYLQLLEGGTQGNNRVQELSKITRSLKKLARDLDIPIIVLSQLSRNVESRINKRPLLADLRESGCVSFLPHSSLSSFFANDTLKKKSCVFSWQGKYLRKQQVKNFRFTGQKPIYKLKTILGWSLLITSNHKLLTSNGWKRIDRLCFNDFIGIKLLVGSLYPSKSSFIYKKELLTWDKLIEIKYQKIAPVYDLHVSTFSNYLTNRVILHNSIEQDADVVIMLYRDEYYNKETYEKNIIEIIVAKHRNGPVGSTKLKFDAKYLRFFNLSN